MWKFIILIVGFSFIDSSILNGTFSMDCMEKYSFKVDYENDQFLLDGKPFQYISGSFHYFRTPKLYWRERLRMIRAAGLNAVSTYIEWSLHEPEPAMWYWDGDVDILEFFDIAQEEDLFILLRPGPYICAERNLGGLPTWLLRLEPDIQLRTNSRGYMKYVERYLDQVLSKIKPYLRGNGGPIVMVQVENEYGSYNACDAQYTNSLKDIFSRNVASNAVLYTTDGPQSSMLRCGSIPDVYTTVDFGASSNVTANFEMMRRFQQKGPLVNSEFYSGWLTHWEEPSQTVPTIKVVKVLDQLLAIGASVNIYMFCGGTNFGFTSGANTDPEYRPQLTSYDYDAPLNEAGDQTPKYFAIRDVVGTYLPLPASSIPKIAKKGAYGVLILKSIIRLLDPLARSLLSSITVQKEIPPTFEELSSPIQLVLYEAHCPRSNEIPVVLNAVVHDRAYVYINHELTSTFSRSHKIFSTLLEDPHGKRLSILVENQGYINYGNHLKDNKGLWNVTVNQKAVLKWNITGFQLDDLEPLHKVTGTFLKLGILNNGPIFLRGIFNIEETPADTYLDTAGWGKGVAYMNGHNIGRYWPLAGPQTRLYIPAAYLKTGENELVVLELEYAQTSCTMKLQSNPK